MGWHGSRLVTITSASLALGCGGLGTLAPEPAAHIALRSDGHCYRSVRVDCPPDASCNPPPPEEVACPPLATQRYIPASDGTCRRDAQLDCPADTDCSSTIHDVACPPSLVRAITRGEDGQCTARRELECPQGAGCEPFPEAPIDCPEALVAPGTLSLSHVYGCLLDGSPADCPPEIPLRPLRDGYVVSVDSDGRCTAFDARPSPCPPDATCNPPPPQRISCPPDVTPTP